MGANFAGSTMLLGESFAGFGLRLNPDGRGFLLALLPPGAFLGLGLLIALRNVIQNRGEAREVARTPIQDATDL